MELSGELGIVAGAVAVGTTGLLLWRRAAALLWQIYLESKVRTLIEAHDECDEAHRLEAVRAGIAANGTAIAKLQEGVLDASQLRRWRRFFEGVNGASELHQLRNDVAAVKLLPELVGKVERLQADQQQDRQRLELCLTKIEAFSERKARRDQDTETDLGKLVRELRDQLGLKDG